MLKPCNGVVAGVLMGLLLSGTALAQEAARMSFGPGEQSRYRVEYLGMTAGSTQITVGAPMKQWGKEVWPIVAIARSEAVAGVWPIKSKFVSYWEASNQRVLGSDLHQDENHKRRRQRIKLSEDGRSAQVVKQREGEAPRESIHELPEGTLDMAGITFALRNRALAVGEEYTYPVFTGSRLFTLRAKVQGKEKLHTLFGPKEVFRVHVHTEFSGKLKSNRDMVVWMTTDPSHVLVRVEADLVLGSVVAELTEYQQGRSVAMSATPAGRSG